VYAENLKSFYRMGFFRKIKTAIDRKGIELAQRLAETSRG
jgi:hypothetical protein